MSLATLLGSRTAKSTPKTKGINTSDPALASAVSEWIVLDSAFDEAKAAKDAHELTLKPMLRRAFFAANAGRSTPESSLKVATPKGTLTVSFAAQWFPSVDSLTDLGIPKRLVRKRVSIKIDVEKIPTDKQEAVIGAILEALDSNGCGEALTAKLVDYPAPAFATERFTVLTPEQNEELEIAGLGTRLSLRR